MSSGLENRGMRTARCSKCSNEWNLTKPLPEYSEGPRCSECGGFEISVEQAQGEAAVVFDALADGADLVDLVRTEGIPPSRVEDLAQRFERLSEYHVLTEAELAERIEAAREEVEGKMGRERREARQKIHRLGQEIDRLRMELAEEYRAGVEFGREEGLEVGYERAREEFEAELEEVREQLEETVEAAEERGRREGRQTATRASYRAGYREAIQDAEQRDFSSAYLEGFDHGVLVGVAEGREAGELAGMKTVVKSLSP